MTPASPVRFDNGNAGEGQGFGSVLFGHAIAFLFCVLFPGLVTAIAPVSHVQFTRNGDDVVANAQVCFFFFIPYRRATIDPVEGVGDRFVAGTLSRRKSGESQTRSEDEAFLVIHGEKESFEVPVTPFNIESVSQRAENFLTDPAAKELKMTVVANWKFSILAGVPISLLTVLYVVGMSLSVLNFLKKLAFPPAK